MVCPVLGYVLPDLFSVVLGLLSDRQPFGDPFLGQMPQTLVAARRLSVVQN